jgi:2,4-dienoyl-CoA reductase-like NADH-dependent reductase (Old Yellow Enzyme family)/thioredoxin reductase
MLLEQPGHIGGLRLKNRVVMAPMGTNYSTTDGLSTARDVAYYAERARGGVGAIMTEAMVVTEQARPHHNSLCCYHDRFIPGLASIVEAIKEHDCHVFGQLNHRGALLRRSVLNMEPVGPSDWINPNTGDAVRALRVAEIQVIQCLFVEAARRLWRAGYDGVEIHAANGYLFQQFFTRRINKRTDQYGGSIENRMRLLLETIDRMRQALPDLRLIVRLSASEYIPEGYTQEEIIELARAVERAGAAAIDLSGGSNESPQLSKYCIQPPSFPRGCLGPVAKPIKNAVSIPVMVAGRVVEPEDGENLLRSGSADFVSLGRALYSDPHWCLKAFGKLEVPIRRCIACNVCFERLTTEKDVSCVQNPMVGTEFEALEHVAPQLIFRRPAQRRRVLVLGAGVAGIEAARVLADKGHEVEVWERTDRVGGQIYLAVAAPDKEEVRAVWEDRWQELTRLKVTVRTGVDADAQRIREFAPDHVLLATGSVPRKPPLPLERMSSAIALYHAWDLFERPQEIPPGARVTIVGGGMVGAELADLLRLQDCSIQVLEMMPLAAVGMARNNRMELLERLAAGGVRLITRCKIEAVIDDQLHVRIADDAPSQLPIGKVLVFATGPQPQLAALAAVEATGVPYTRIGDAQTPGDFLAAIRDGWMAALALDAERRAHDHSIAARPVEVGSTA